MKNYINIMYLLSLLLVPLIGLVYITNVSLNYPNHIIKQVSAKVKKIGILICFINLIQCIFIYTFINMSTNQYEFVQYYYEINNYNIYLGIDGISIYFILLTSLIMPVSILSNWVSINEKVVSYICIMLILEALLLLVFMVLDIMLFYIYFESILAPLFILIGIYGSKNKIRASFYLFLYTLIGSLFLLLSIISMCSIAGATDFDTLLKMNFNYSTQVFLFCGIFIAFAVKTPLIFLNTWLLKAHVESPLGGSIILAGVVLKLSLYGILRLLLPILSKISLMSTYFVFSICAITIVYASISTLRTIDIKELIAYSSVSHAAVYVLGAFSNTIQGIQGAIALGLAHGFVSPALFICVGGVLYDRTSSRLITYYRGLTQVMPMFSFLFFLLCLSNCAVPLTLNFIGEFLCLYGTFERMPLIGIISSSSIVLSACYSIYMFNRISFAGMYTKYFFFNLPDINKREFNLLLILLVLTITFGIYTTPILDVLHYSVSSLIY